MRLIITRHGRERLRGRLGLPKRAHKRGVRRAWEDGITPDRANEVPHTAARRMGQAVTRGCTARYHSGVVWVFAMSGENEAHLVTVFFPTPYAP